MTVYQGGPSGYLSFPGPKPQPKPKAPVIPGSISEDAGTYYGGILTNDPRYTGGEKALTTIYDPLNPNAGTAAADRDAAINRAKGLYADPNNPHNVFNELQYNYLNNKTRTDNSLESRGILNSGAKDQAEGQLGHQYSLDNYNATNQLNDLVSQALAGYRTAGDTYGVQHAQLVRDVTAQLQNDPSIAPPPKAFLVQGWQTLYGVPVFADAQGNLYGADKKPFTGGSRNTRAPRPSGTFGGV